MLKHIIFEAYIKYTYPPLTKRKEEDKSLLVRSKEVTSVTALNIVLGAAIETSKKMFSLIITKLVFSHDFHVGFNLRYLVGDTEAIYQFD